MHRESYLLFLCLRDEWDAAAAIGRISSFRRPHTKRSPRRSELREIVSIASARRDISTQRNLRLLHGRKLIGNKGRQGNLSHPIRFFILIKDIVSDVCNVLVNDTEAFPRRSAVQVLLVWLDGLAGFRDSLTRSDSLDVRSPILDALHRAKDDFDWEVKRHVLDFWFKLTRTESSTKATSILERANAMDDVIKALNDPNRIVREKASEIARSLADDTSPPTRIVDEIVDKEADGGCGGELTSSFDADAISLLQDLIACGGGRSRDDESMLLDCY